MSQETIQALFVFFWFGILVFLGYVITGILEQRKQAKQSKWIDRVFAEQERKQQEESNAN